ncbi:glutaredoxin family protein [Niallia oryzisoli]|uniref:glutaredoxin family protein n=1 Tax=Niallia oryzisoli TaxID=1737571 RepID=UPI0037367E32
MNQITVYTTNTCSYCVMLKNFLTQEGLTFKEINVQKDQRAANKLVSTTGHLGVPQTEINGQWVLGYDPDTIKNLVR